MSFIDRIFGKKKQIATIENAPRKRESDEPVTVEPGRVSVPEDDNVEVLLSLFNGKNKLITPSFRTDLIPILRKLYKVNPDVGIALQDMFKLANGGHVVKFPNNTDEQEKKMLDHLDKASERWSTYTAGIDGLVNKFITQILVTGAISVEAVPTNELDGISTILFLKPENIFFIRENNGVYLPYQKNPKAPENKKPDYIPLNIQSYFYVSMFNDLDEPYGVPPFMPALDSLVGQHDMKTNFKHIMELMGMLGFLEVLIRKPAKNNSESLSAYESRLKQLLKKAKENIHGGLKDGIVTGYEDDHQFNFHSTTQSLQNLDKIWAMNQQSVANGLGVNSNIIGVQESSSEGGAGILLSKMISQLKNIQMIVSFVLKKIYSLELKLAGFDNKGLEIIFNTTTIADEVKVQQGLEYKIRNLIALYNQGILSQEDVARELGYRSPNKKKPRIELVVSGSNLSPKKEEGSKGDKNAKERRARAKGSSKNKRGDQDTRKR